MRAHVREQTVVAKRAAMQLALWRRTRVDERRVALVCNVLGVGVAIAQERGQPRVAVFASLVCRVQSAECKLM